MNSLIKKFLFALDPETAHTVAVKMLQAAYFCGLTKIFYKTILNPCEIMGLKFTNRVGLAAGFDKNGDYVDALASLGFGFIEIGTVTPKPQIGNPRPRLFRLNEQEAIINRMGFNNKGVDHMVKQLEKTHYRGVLGINIGKNKDTPLANAIDDYLFCFRALWKFASYITINISSPNTVGLRNLQQAEFLNPFLSALKKEQKIIAEQYKKYVPLVVKISPDLPDEELQELAIILLHQQMDGVIATNTTVKREGIENVASAKETGGLSGRPLMKRATHTLEQLHAVLQNKIPIIASGGIIDKTSAQEKFKEGASLVQIYTGFIYQGPGLIQLLNRH